MLIYIFKKNVFTLFFLACLSLVSCSNPESETSQTKPSKLVVALLPDESAATVIQNNKGLETYLENKLNKRGDVLIFVEAKRKDIQKRLEKRKYFNKKLNRNLKSLQLPLTKKKKLSNFVINPINIYSWEN